MNLIYLADDVSDERLARRVALLTWGGCDVRVAGFRQGTELRSAVHVPIEDLGVGSPEREVDAAIGAAMAGADVVVARTPVLLLPAVRARSPGMRLVYDRPAAPVRRGRDGPVRGCGEPERSALSDVDLTVVDSAEEMRELRDAGHAGPVLLLEDKVVALGSTVDDCYLPPLPHEASWVIGWVGHLRCQRSWNLLRALVEQGRGQIEVLVAGLPSGSSAGAGAARSSLPGIRVIDHYIPADLPALRASMHFSWLIDHQADASNAPTALPHDLFEDIAHCSVPIALAGSRAGDWLARRGAGVLVEEPERELAAMLSDIDDAGYAALVQGIERIPKRDYLILPDEAQAFVSAVTGRG